MDLGECHICLNVADLNASLDFYIKLGLELRQDHRDEGWAVVAHNNLILALYQGHIERTLINFRGGDVAAITAAAAASGLPIAEPAREYPNGSWNATLHDPDGHVIFLNTFPSEREQYLREKTVIPPDDF